VRRRFGWAGLVVAGAVVVAALFAVTGYGELADHPDAYTLSLAPAVGGYARVPQGPPDTLTSADSFVSGAQTAVYQLTGQPGVLAAGSIRVDVGRISGISPGRALSRIYANFESQVGKIAAGQAPRGQSSAGRQGAAGRGAAAQVTVGAPLPVPTGPLGGLARCWPVRAPAETGSGQAVGASCLWADSRTFGFLFAPGLSTSRLATTLLMFRSAIEIQSP